MSWHIHDPGHVALHRGVRAAIGVPVAMALALWLLPGTPGPLLAAFGVLVTVSTADFGGSRMDRLRALVGTGLAGLLLLSIGILAGSHPWSAVLVTFAVTAFLAFIAVLHGAVASGAAALSIVYVVSVSLGVPVSSLGSILAGWMIALAVAIPLALFVLPRRTTAPVKQATAAALHALADTAERRLAGVSPDLDALRAAEADLRRSYVGNPFRAAGLDARSHALHILVAQTQGLLAACIRGRFATDLVRTPATLHLSEQTARCFRASAAALTDPQAPTPSGLAVAATWEHQWNEATDMLVSSAMPGSSAGSSSASGDDSAARVSDMFPDRSFGLAAVRITMLARRVVGAPPEDYAPVLGKHTIPEPPAPQLARELAHQANLRSPWARLALRTGAAIALAMVVVEMMGLAHGFWVMLGVVSVLRFDAFTTLKMGALAIAGTLTGAIVGVFVILVDDRNEGLMWLIFVLAVFLATWAPGAIGFMVGQAAFSLFVIIAFSLIAWPPELATAEQRVLDICIGVLLSIVVAGVMWPRGLLGGLLLNMAEAIDAATALLTGAVAALVDGPTAATRTLPGDAMAALARAREVVELSLSSSSPQAAVVAMRWQSVIDNLRTVTVAGPLLANWSYDRPPIAHFAPTLGPPLVNECAMVTSTWGAVADDIRSADSVPVPDEKPAGRLEAVLPAVRTVDLSSTEVADRALAAIWGHGWLELSWQAGRAAQTS